MSQIKVTTLMTSDGAKQATSTDVIDGAAKTKLFSPFSLTMLAGVDAPALRSSLAAAKSGANSDITSLTGLTTPLSVDQGGTGKITEFRKGFIDGLRMVYTGRTSLTVEAGSAYIASTGKILELTTDKVMTGLTLSVSSFYHVYLYDNAGVADIEISTTVPVRYYGTAYQKTGDATRRYIGSALTGTGGFFKFQHDPQLNRMNYIEGLPGTAPFQLLAAYNNATPANLSTVNAAVPKETTVSIRATAGGTGFVMNFSQTDQQAAPGGSQWGAGVIGSSECVVPVSRTPATLGQVMVWTNGSMSLYCQGYFFER
jgi:hypothetical protein